MRRPRNLLIPAFAATLTACSPAAAGNGKAALDDKGCPVPSLVLDDKGNVFHNGRSFDNHGAQAPQDAPGHTVASIATLPNGTIYWNCEKITQDELDRRFVAARAEARSSDPSPPVQPAGANP